MIRSTNVSLKFSHQGKIFTLDDFIDEYKNLVSFFVDKLWSMEKIPKLIPIEITSKPESWLSARMRQCAAKQASGIVRGTKTKAAKREWQINHFIETGMLKKARKLQKIHDEKSVSKPDISRVCPELDSRFIEVDVDNETSFDCWITITSVGNKVKLQLPFKRTKHFNEMFLDGIMKNGLRLSKKYATIMFDIEDPEPKKEGGILGIDIGLKNTISCSNGFSSKQNNHGHDLNSITKVMSKRKKGSSSFKKSVSHRKNYINWSINQLNLKDIKQVNIENIKYLRKGRRTNRFMSHWTYTDIFGKLESLCQEQGVLVNKVNPTYTSQRCSACGWVRKSNRKGKRFKCEKCSLIMDSDLNASLNLALNLMPIGKKERLSQKNRKGFYWFEISHESIVHGTK